MLRELHYTGREQRRHSIQEQINLIEKKTKRGSITRTTTIRIITTTNLLKIDKSIHTSLFVTTTAHQLHIFMLYTPTCFG
jgi:hypothetical protein